MPPSVRASVTIPDDLAARLDALHAPLPDPQDLRFAAVVGLLLRGSDRDPEPRLLLIERSRSLRAHAGQVAFPGGKPEPSDASLCDTATREASEEVGLPATGTRILGRLPVVPTPSGFLIVPFVGLAPPGWEPRIASGEVHRLLTPSLARLADPEVHAISEGVWRDRTYTMHEYRVHEPPIWGATALMVHGLLTRMELI